ncbi:MAG TPA: hypothetical protein VKR56_16395 [Candidatus Cybelea sp.]|nr:hypothetical protein [Candidatus Cybelea sp.]
MKAFLPVLFAGGSFAGAAILGLLVGVAAADRLGEPLLTPAGLLLGLIAGGYAGLRLLAKSME